jgi:hypothetical protein
MSGVSAKIYLLSTGADFSEMCPIKGPTRRNNDTVEELEEEEEEEEDYNSSDCK